MRRVGKQRNRGREGARDRRTRAGERGVDTLYLLQAFLYTGSRRTEAGFVYPVYLLRVPSRFQPADPNPSAWIGAARFRFKRNRGRWYSAAPIYARIFLRPAVKACLTSG